MRLPGFTTRNLRLKAFATVLATVTWAAVVYASNPPDSRSVTINVPQSSGQVAPYVLVHPIAPAVIRVIGTRQHLNAFDPNDLVLTVNYKAIARAGTQSLPLTVTNNDRDVILDTPPTSVVAEVDHLGSATVPVTVVISTQPPQGYVETSTSTDPSTVTVIGPQNQLAGVQAKVSVDLANQKTNFQGDETVGLYDATNQKLGGFGVTIVTIAGHQPGTVLVNVAVTASLTSRASAVLPRVTGTVAPGHEVAATTQSPLVVVLNGPQDLLNNLDSIPTDPISVNGLASTRTFVVHIVTPPGVTANPGTVSVTITVVAVPSSSPTPTPTPTP
ncbi:MAG: CdaR family protein [Candidatus Dormibacter sp.]